MLADGDWVEKTAREYGRTEEAFEELLARRAKGRGVGPRALGAHLPKERERRFGAR